MVMAETPLKRKLPLSKVLQQGGYNKPKTLTDVANSLSLKAKYLRKLPSLKPDLREADERLYGTRNGLISATFSTRKNRANPYFCILQQKKTLDRVKSEVTEVDRTVAEARRRHIVGRLKNRSKSEFEEVTESIFLTSLITPTPAHHPATTSFTEVLDDSTPPGAGIAPLPGVRLLAATAVKRSVSLRAMKILEITTHCDDIARSVVESKTGLEKDMRTIKDKLGLYARHLSVLEIERRRRKYFLLRKTFQMDTKVKSPSETHAVPPRCRRYQHSQRNGTVLRLLLALIWATVIAKQSTSTIALTS